MAEMQLLATERGRGFDLARGNDTLQWLLHAVVQSPGEELNWQALADWVEEHDDPLRAQLLRTHRKLLHGCSVPSAEHDACQSKVCELLGRGVLPLVPQHRVVLPGEVTMSFSFIPPGSFLMGRSAGESGDNDEVPQHRVTLTKGFFLGVHQVTQAQWQKVMGGNPSDVEGDNHPVESVSWEDCQEFCQKLGERDGKKYRLPTEAEWEYACRAGTATEYHSGNGVDALRKVGCCSFDGNWGSAKKTKPVGQFAPNAWGLYDMHGNVWEWCLDGKRVYQSEGIKDPVGLQGDGNVRVLRGGSWNSYSYRCRSAHRYDFQDFGRSPYFGCRVLLCLD